MTATSRQSVAQLGPRDGSTWTVPFGSVQAAPAASVETPIFVVPPITANLNSGRSIQDRLAADNVIYNLSQVFLTAITDHAGAEGGSAVTFNLYRAGALIGGGGFAGWIDGAAPVINTWNPVVVPFLVANTALRGCGFGNAPSATKAVLPLQPLDVITVVSALPTDAFSYVSLDGA